MALIRFRASDSNDFGGPYNDRRELFSIKDATLGAREGAIKPSINRDRSGCCCASGNNTAAAAATARAEEAEVGRARDSRAQQQPVSEEVPRERETWSEYSILYIQQREPSGPIKQAAERSL